MIRPRLGTSGDATVNTVTYFRGTDNHGWTNTYEVKMNDALQVTTTFTGMPEEIMRTHPYSVWMEEIQILSKKDFTFQADRLPSLASLASLMADITGSQYLAGLWRKNIGGDLLFSRNENTRRGRICLPFHDRLRLLSAPGSMARPSWS